MGYSLFCYIYRYSVIVGIRFTTLFMSKAITNVSIQNMNCGTLMSTHIAVLCYLNIFIYILYAIPMNNIVINYFYCNINR